MHFREDKRQQQAGTLEEGGGNVEREMDSNEQEKERGKTIPHEGLSAVLAQLGSDTDSAAAAPSLSTAPRTRRATGLKERTAVPRQPSPAAHLQRALLAFRPRRTLARCLTGENSGGIASRIPTPMRHISSGFGAPRSGRRIAPRRSSEPRCQSGALGCALPLDPHHLSTFYYPG